MAGLSTRIVSKGLMSLTATMMFPFSSVLLTLKGRQTPSGLKYFTEMQKRNIAVTRMTIQNEPHVKGQFAATYPSMGFTPEQERDFLRDFLGKFHDSFCLVTASPKPVPIQ